MKVGLYCYLTADILSKFLHKFSLGSHLPNIWLLSKYQNLIDCHGNQKSKFEKKYSKIISSEVKRGIKLKLCINVHNINFYNNYVLLQLLMYFRYCGNLKFSLTCNGKSENWHLLLSHCRDFHERFSEMFVEWSSTNVIGCHGNQKVKFPKIIQISTLRSYMGDKAETLRNTHSMSL